MKQSEIEWHSADPYEVLTVVYETWVHCGHPVTVRFLRRYWFSTCYDIGHVLFDLTRYDGVLQWSQNKRKKLDMYAPAADLVV
jgi:hypothetical protein